MILKYKIIKIFISVLLIVSFASASCFGAFAETSESATPDGNANISNDLSENLNDDSYSDYLSAFSKSAYTENDITVQTNDFVLETQPLEFDINVSEEGLYAIGMSYAAMDDALSEICIGLMIYGEFPYSKAEKLKFSRMYTDDKTQTVENDSADEYAPQQLQYNGVCYNEAFDETGENGDRYLVYLSLGTHKVKVLPVNGKISIEYFKFVHTSSSKAYSSSADENQYYNGDTIAIEGEDAYLKSSYFFTGKSDTSSTDVSPQSAERSRINYIGGGNWKTIGETIIWETPELKAGYYTIGFSFRQNSVIGGKSYRSLLIDGEIPFAEAETVGFKYNDNWQREIYSDDNGNPYLIYLSEGKHEISLRVTAGDIGEVRNYLSDAVSALGELYVDISKITGETVDIYRDYDLFNQIGDMEERLNKIRSDLQNAGEKLLNITGEKSGSNYSVIVNMIEVIDQMLENKYESHRYKKYYYTNYCSVSSVLQDLRSMPLDIDKIILASPNEAQPFEKVGFFNKIAFSLKRFVFSFMKEYDSISVSDEQGESSITIWVSWGRDQAQVLDTLITRSFTPETGINVNIKLVNATVIQAILSGKGPDCRLQQARSEPVNLAMRGVLYDLSQFEDYEDVLGQFMDGADTPYWYNNGLYALPDTQSFYMMFYRKDILAEYGIDVPETWDEFDLAAKLLARNNMTVCFPNAVVTDAVTGQGVGAATIYPTLLMQNDVPLYSEDGKKTNLLSSEAMQVFEKWTNYYTKMKFPISIDFYNRFRTGMTPLGISTYSLYTQLKVAASEIDGLWGVTAIPGTVREDGSVSHASAGSGSGCSILEMSEHKEEAWEFLKWWVSADTQLNFSNELEAVLGSTGRVTVSNVEALKNMSWDDGDLDEILNAWKEVEEVPEYPGSYYVARSIYQAYWNVVNANKNGKDMLMKFGKEADDEIIRKWNQYTDRG